MMKLLSLALAAILINNVVLTKYLGLCPFFGVSKNFKSAIGMGLAVTFVIFGASLITYFLYYAILVPNQMEYMRLITFILVIASFVQLVEMFIKKYSAS
ncbi:MAG: electron transport complex subunit RsxA, partial [Erysipelotrichaceae bacterium]|nr:electron transport complex subunit RsxA [Erysipelotrichaceae bacterium]